MTTKEFLVTSPKNITFRQWVDTGIEMSDWNELSDSERDEAIIEALYNGIIEISNDGPEDDDGNPLD